MRVTTAFKRLLRLDGVTVTSVELAATIVAVTVVLRRGLICPHCAHKTRVRYDTRPVESRWRHLDLGVWQVELRASLRRPLSPAATGRFGITERRSREGMSVPFPLGP